jgi:hypothetical protein
MIVEVPVSVGELMDKITILMIKEQFARTPEQKTNINKELTLLKNKVDSLGLGGHPAFDSLLQALTNINTALWHIEDNVRKTTGMSDQTFIKLARSVHTTNDERSHIKKQINTIFQSELVEEKIY